MTVDTLIDLLDTRARSTPDRVVYRFLADGETQSSALTLAQLDDGARRVAATLQQSLAPGSRVVLLFPPGLEFTVALWGCLYAGMVGVPVALPHSSNDARVLDAIMQSATPSALLGSADGIASIGETVAAGVARLDLGVALSSPSFAWRHPDVTRRTLAYLQYTSGSTSLPKGVMVSHDNVLGNVADIDAGFRHTPESVCVSWLPHYHDMGLVYGILQPVYAGSTAVLLPPIKFVQRPFRWLAAITEWRATHSGAPDFAYALCCRRIAADERERLDLSTWRVAFDGAEPVRAETIREFTATFAHCGFRTTAFCPAYGLAEATLKVTARAPESPLAIRSVLPAAVLPDSGAGLGPRREVVGCGGPGDGTTVLIVHPETCAPVAADTVGEIWVRGPGVALGYWQLPAETERVFAATIRGGAGPAFLRTGDLGCVRDGQLFVTGRLKDMLIVRGQNVYPEDLELAAERAVPDLRRGGVAAFGVDVAGLERVVVAAEIERVADAAAGSAFVRRIAETIRTEHQVPLHAVVLLRRGGIPRTTSGKVKRHDCRTRFLRHGLNELYLEIVPSAHDEDDAAPRIDRRELDAYTGAKRTARLHAYVRALVAAVTRSPMEELRDDASLVALGVDSLAASELCGRLSDHLNVDVSPVLVMSGLSIRGLVSELAIGVNAPRVSTDRRFGEDEPGSYPLSYAQESVWSVYVREPTNAAYNIARAFWCDDPFDLQAFRTCVETLVRRHAALRTSFAITLEGPMRVVHEQGRVQLTVYDGATLGEAALLEQAGELAREPFGLESDPLLRVAVFETGARRLILLCVHHIVVDLQSLDLLLEELGDLYSCAVSGRAPTPPPQGSGLAAFVQWQRQLIDSDRGEASWSYWRETLAAEPPVLELAPDYPRDPVKRYAGAMRTATIPAAVQQRLRALAEAHDATMYVTLLTVYVLLLYRYTGQRSLWVGSPVSGRHLAEFARTIGHFVDLTVLTAEVDPRASFTTLLKQVRRRVLGAIEHAAFPFRLLVERLAPPRDASRTPLVQTLFALHRGQRIANPESAPLFVGHGGAVLRVGPMRWQSIALDLGASQFDLSLFVAEAPDGLAATLEYDSRLFSAATAEQMLVHYARLAENVSRDPDQPVLEVPMLRDDERRAIVWGWNETRASYEPEVLLHQLIEGQVSRTPGATALLFEDEQLTYAQLDRRATALAGRLQLLGVTADARVGVCMHRGLDLPVALLAILKAGGAYVPLDPSFPDHYVNDIIAGAGLTAVLASADTVERARQLPLPWVDVSTGTAFGHAARPDALATVRASPLNLAYIIYTSGSTGKPKGVMNTHAGICNRLLWMQGAYRLDASDTVLQKTPLTFDVSVWELFWPLLAGARLAIARPGGHRDVGYLLDTIDRYGVTTLHFVPAMLRVLLDAPDLTGCRGLRRVICSGEALPAATMRRLHERLSAELHNLYGPTEAAVDVSWWPCRPGADDAEVPIGRPIANVRLYLLDDNMEPVPVGARGQIFIGGIALARGYADRPDLTAERFVPDPFEPGGRLYATGDVGRYRADGAIEFLGRSDHQVKIRGFRVELEEVAAAIRRCTGVRDCVVVAVPRTGDTSLLAAYVVADPEVRDALNRELARTLPEYMVPSAFVFLDALPLSINGKIDRKKLPAPKPADAIEYVAPRTPLEEEIGRVWARAFNVPRVGVHDNFFDLGGHSLLATDIITRLNHQFQVSLPAVLLLSGTPSIALLAEAVAAELSDRQSELV